MLSQGLVYHQHCCISSLRSPDTRRCVMRYSPKGADDIRRTSCVDDIHAQGRGDIQAHKASLMIYAALRASMIYHCFAMDKKFLVALQRGIFGWDSWIRTSVVQESKSCALTGLAISQYKIVIVILPQFFVLVNTFMSFLLFTVQILLLYFLLFCPMLSWEANPRILFFSDTYKVRCSSLHNPATAL